MGRRQGLRRARRRQGLGAAAILPAVDYNETEHNLIVVTRWWRSARASVEIKQSQLDARAIAMAFPMNTQRSSSYRSSTRTAANRAATSLRRTSRYGRKRSLRVGVPAALEERPLTGAPRLRKKPAAAVGGFEFRTRTPRRLFKNNKRALKLRVTTSSRVPQSTP